MVKAIQGSDGNWYVHLYPYTARAIVQLLNQRDAEDVALALNGAREKGQEEVREKLRELIGASKHVVD